MSLKEAAQQIVFRSEESSGKAEEDIL